jgi:hypothetical protein
LLQWFFVILFWRCRKSPRAVFLSWIFNHFSPRWRSWPAL